MHYDEPVFRPPSEARSLIVQVSIGCSHNRCAFCGMYKDKQFRIRPLDALRPEISEAGKRWPHTRRVFLADGDALALPTDTLVEILHQLHGAFPELSRVGVYVNAANVLAKTDAELRRLSDQKLRMGYLGLESGHRAVLKEMCKGADVAQNESLALTKGAPRDLDPGAVDGRDPLALAVALEHDAAATKGVGDQTVGARLDVGALDRQDLLGRVEVPRLAAAAGLETGRLELRAHGAVGEERAPGDGLEQGQLVTPAGKPSGPAAKRVRQPSQQK